MGAVPPRSLAEGAETGLGHVVETIGQALYWIVVGAGILTPIVFGIYGTLMR